MITIAIEGDDLKMFGLSMNNGIGVYILDSTSAIVVRTAALGVACGHAFLTPY